MRLELIVNSAPSIFYMEVNDTVLEMAEQGYHVDVQYQMAIQDDGKALHSALIIGRNKGES